MIPNYQNYIDDLPNLEIYRYENIFKVYTSSDNEYYIYNILKTVKVPLDLNNQFFDLVTLQSNTPWTTLSYQIYGTTYLWWLLCIFNNIQNPFDAQNNGKQLKVLKKQYVKGVLDIIKQQLQ